MNLWYEFCVILKMKLKFVLRNKKSYFSGCWVIRGDRYTVSLDVISKWGILWTNRRIHSIREQLKSVFSMVLYVKENKHFVSKLQLGCLKRIKILYQYLNRAIEITKTRRPWHFNGWYHRFQNDQLKFRRKTFRHGKWMKRRRDLAHRI